MQLRVLVQWFARGEGRGARLLIADKTALLCTLSPVDNERHTKSSDRLVGRHFTIDWFCLLWFSVSLPFVTSVFLLCLFEFCRALVSVLLCKPPITLLLYHAGVTYVYSRSLKVKICKKQFQYEVLKIIRLLAAFMCTNISKHGATRGFSSTPELLVSVMELNEVCQTFINERMIAHTESAECVVKCCVLDSCKCVAQSVNHTLDSCYILR